MAGICRAAWLASPTRPLLIGHSESGPRGGRIGFALEIGGPTSDVRCQTSDFERPAVQRPAKSDRRMAVNPSRNSAVRSLVFAAMSESQDTNVTYPLHHHHLSHLPRLQADEEVFATRFASSCSMMNCSAKCCRGGVYVDLEHRDRILREAPLVDRAHGADAGAGPVAVVRVGGDRGRGFSVGEVRRHAGRRDTAASSSTASGGASCRSPKRRRRDSSRSTAGHFRSSSPTGR